MVGTNPPAPVQHNEGAYRFCFIEKNRLDEFARIASRTPSDQRQLIATLFGVDQFADFVRGFNPSLDDDLDLIGLQGQELARRRGQLATAEQTMQTNPEKLEQFAANEAVLAARIIPDSSYADACDWLLGTGEQQGRLASLQAYLDASPPVVYGVTSTGIATLLAAVNQAKEDWQTTTAELIKRTGEVSYKKMYEAVIQLADTVPSACPACGTDLITSPKTHMTAPVRAWSNSLISRSCNNVQSNKKMRSKRQCESCTSL